MWRKIAFTFSTLALALPGIPWASEGAGEVPEGIRPLPEMRAPDVFCEQTVPSYARAIREGYRDNILLDLANEPSFRKMDRQLQASFIRLIDAAARMPEQDVERECKKLVSSTLSSLSVAQIADCQLWGRSAEIMLQALRSEPEGEVLAEVERIEQANADMGKVYRSLYEQGRQVDPGVSPQKYGSAYYRTCLTLIIDDKESGNGK